MMHHHHHACIRTLHTTYYLTLHISLRVFKFLMECYCGGTLGHPVRKCMYDSLFRCRICRHCRSFAGQSGVPVQGQEGRGSEKKFLSTRNLGLKASTQAGSITHRKSSFWRSTSVFSCDASPKSMKCVTSALFAKLVSSYVFQVST